MYGDWVLLKYGGAAAYLILAAALLICSYWAVVICRNHHFCELFISRYSLQNESKLNKLYYTKHSKRNPRIGFVIKTYLFAISLMLPLLVLFILEKTTTICENLEEIICILSIIPIGIVALLEIFIIIENERCKRIQKKMEQTQIIDLRKKIEENFPNYFN